MTSTNEEESKKPLKLSRPGRLELKKTIDAGQVRQSFPHGRSKTVAVEVKRKRTFAPGAGGRMTEVTADAAGIGPDLAVQAVEAGGLAGAVRADQREKLARPEREAHIVHRLDAAIGLAQALDLEHGHQTRALLARRAWAKPTMPCGKASTRTTMITPTTSGQWRVSVANSISRP